MHRVEIRDVGLPEQMQRAMARQAEAERERRAKIIAAEGELQASQKLGEAADVITRSPGALQLRQLQTMAEISAENSSTIIFPIPIEIMGAIAAVTNALGGAAAGARRHPGRDADRRSGREPDDGRRDQRDARRGDPAHGDGRDSAAAAEARPPAPADHPAPTPTTDLVAGLGVPDTVRG